MSESAVKAKRRFFGVVTSPVRRWITTFVSMKDRPVRTQALKRGAIPRSDAGSRMAQPAAAMTESREASIGARGPERSSQRPAAIARNMGPNEIEASMRPTSKDEAPA